MKKLHSLIILFTLLVSGCSEDEILRNEITAVSGRIYTASFEQNDGRTYLENGLYSRWTEDDRISLFDTSTLNCQYLFTGDTGDSGGTFIMLSKPEGTGMALTSNYAVYPYSEDVKMVGDEAISIILPTEQHYAKNSYGLGDNTMVAVTENTDDTFLSFKNVVGCFKLQLYGDDVTVKSITLKGNNGELISGNATITIAYDEEPIVMMEDDATDYIMMDCGEKGVKIGSSAKDATAFWMLVPPTTFEKGLTVMVMDIEGNVFTQIVEKRFEIERNVVKPMVAVEAKMEPVKPKLTYVNNAAELEDWSEALFCNDGSYYMAKPSDDDGCIVTIGNFITEENCLIHIDKDRHVREISSGCNIFTFNNYTGNTVDISCFDENGTRITETVVRSSTPIGRSSDDHEQQINGINMGLNMWSIKEATNDIAENKSMYKYGRGWQSYLLNVFNALGTAYDMGGGSENDLFDNLATDIIGSLDTAVSLGEMEVELIKSLNIKNPKLKLRAGGPLVWAITSWLDFSATYLELYDKHIKVYYGNSIASINKIKYEDNELKIDLQVSGYENWYNLECGVIVRKSNNQFFIPFAGKFPDGVLTRNVSQNGIYSFSISGLDENETYDCYPFLIEKSRTSLWIGFIGKMAGPLVRYGKAVKYSLSSKKISGLRMSEDGEVFDDWDFYYRNDTISSIKLNGKYEENCVCTFNYSDNGYLSAKASYLEEYTSYSMKLNDEGYAVSCRQRYCGDGTWTITWRFKYNEEGQLIYVSNSDNQSWTITYQDSNAVRLGGSNHSSISYGDLEGRGYWILYDWMCGIDFDDEMEIFGLLGLFGKPSRNLPTTISGDDYMMYYNWSLNDDGYPSRLSVDGIVMNFSWE